MAETARVRGGMKVKNESEKLPAYHKKIAAVNAGIGGICDFCGVREARHSVNENRWHICHPCMRMVQEDIPQAIKDSFEKWLEEEE